jgi:hypothetical protein
MDDASSLFLNLGAREIRAAALSITTMSVREGWHGNGACPFCLNLPGGHGQSIVTFVCNYTCIYQRTSSGQMDPKFL